jgi:hypothetical protein
MSEEMKCKDCGRNFLTFDTPPSETCPICEDSESLVAQTAPVADVPCNDGLSADLISMLDILNTSIEHREAPPIGGPVHKKVISLLDEWGREPTFKAGGR